MRRSSRIMRLARRRWCLQPAYRSSWVRMRLSTSAVTRLSISAAIRLSISAPMRSTRPSASAWSKPGPRSCRAATEAAISAWLSVAIMPSEHPVNSCRNGTDLGQASGMRLAPVASWGFPHPGCSGAGTQEAEVVGGVGAVDELVDRAGRRQPSDLRVRDRLSQRGSEAVGADDLIGPVIEAARAGIQRWGESQLVVQRGDDLVSLAQVLLAYGPAARG